MRAKTGLVSVIVWGVKAMFVLEFRAVSRPVRKRVSIRRGGPVELYEFRKTIEVVEV